MIQNPDLVTSGMNMPQAVYISFFASRPVSEFTAENAQSCSKEILFEWESNFP